MAPGVDCPECTGEYYTSILVNNYGVNATYIDIRPENDLVNDPETARFVWFIYFLTTDDRTEYHLNKQIGPFHDGFLLCWWSQV